MSVARCLKCRQEVRLPSSHSAVWVKCPLCAAEYAIDDVLDQLPPRLLVVPPPERTNQGESLATESAMDLLKDDQLTPISPSLIVTEPLKHADVPPDDRLVNVPSPQKLHAERKKMRMNSPHRLAPVKVALGGIVGLLLGQLVLWWLPGNLRRDPFDFAPKLPQSLAFLAPAALRGEVAGWVEGADLPVADPLSELPPVPKESRETASDVDRPVDSSRLFVGLADAPQFRLSEMRDALEQASNEQARYRKTSTDPAAWFASLTNLAHRITFVHSAETEVTQFARDTRALLAQMGESELQINLIGTMASQQLEDLDHHRKGIAVVGEVVRIRRVDKLFQVEMELAGEKPKLIRVISRADPTDNPLEVFDVGDRVIVLGVVVKDPSLFLLGYQGNADLVVFGGFSLRIDKP